LVLSNKEEGNILTLRGQEQMALQKQIQLYNIKKIYFGANASLNNVFDGKQQLQKNGRFSVAFNLQYIKYSF
jgi:hypothetical protein